MELFVISAGIQAETLLTHCNLTQGHRGMVISGLFYRDLVMKLARFKEKIITFLARILVEKNL